MRWNNNFEKFTFATLRSQRVLRINSDFGAVVSVPTQDTDNQAVPTRMLQCICITVMLEEIKILEGGQSVILYNTYDMHVWSQSGFTLESDHFYVYQVLRKIFKHFRNTT